MGCRLSDKSEGKVNGVAGKLRYSPGTSDTYKHITPLNLRGKKPES